MDDTGSSSVLASALDYARVGRLPGRCAHCGFHVRTQGHRNGCHRDAPVASEARKPVVDFIARIKPNIARQQAVAPVQRSRRVRKRDGEGGCSGYGLSALERECEILASTPGGQRNDQLNRAAFNLGQLVTSGHLPEEAVVDALSYEARRIGLQRREISPSLQSGLNKGKVTPRGPKA